MHRVLLVFLALSCTSCNTLRKLTHARPKANELTSDDDSQRNQAIGSIEMVNPDTRFVLIRLAVNIPMAAGTELSSMGTSGQVTKLKLTPERKGLYMTADIVSGEPKKGDIIYTGTASATAPAIPPVTAGPPSAANPPTISISPATASPGAPLPLPTEPTPLVPGGTPSDFLRIVPR